MNTLAHIGATFLKGQLRQASPLSGGDLSEAVMIELKSGEKAIVKNGPSPPIEAEMLAALRAAGAPTPDILAVSENALVLAILPNDGAMNRSWTDMAHVLNTVHNTEQNWGIERPTQARSTLYGWPKNYAFGRLAIQNTPNSNWVDFWTENRLIPHLPFLPAAQAKMLQDVIDHAGDLIPAHPKPALLHGDLWGGNILCNKGKITGLIDPACYYGHAEVDIAMLTLFDHPAETFWSHLPFVDRALAARLSFYKLWPALVHFRLFGSSYLTLVSQCMEESGLRANKT